VYSDPYEAERRILDAAEELLRVHTEVGYTNMVDLQVDPVDLESLVTYSDAEHHVADALVYGAIFGIHYAEEAQSDIARRIEKQRTSEPEWRKAGLKLSGRGIMSLDEWNRWTLKLVRIWEREHGIALPMQELEAVLAERSALIDLSSDEFKEPLDRASDGFTQMVGRSRRFRATVASFDPPHPETWTMVGRSFAVGFCVGAGWLDEDTAFEHTRILARAVKRSIKSEKSRRFGWLLGRLTIPLPSDDTVAQAYLLAMWEGTRFGAEKHNRPALAARAEQQRQLLLA